MGDHYHVVEKLLARGWGYLLMKKVSKIAVRLKGRIVTCFTTPKYFRTRVKKGTNAVLQTLLENEI